MNIVVQKFGGTSVSTKERRTQVINKILQTKQKQKNIVVVVSALGRKGDAYATDTLRNLLLEENPLCSLKTLDLLMSCGEIISATLLGSALEALGEKVIVLTGAQAGILTDDHFSNAEIIAIDEKRSLSYLEKDYIVVVPGFQGATASGEVTTLGRGGSDTTATALAVALNAEYVEIYTDVDGIMTADPNVVPRARILDQVNYNEVFQMAEKGAKVIHPRAVEIAQKKNIPVNIRNTMSEHPGTRIHSFTGDKESLYCSQPKKNLLTAITHKDGISQVSVHMENNLAHDSLLLSTLAESKVSIDMINFFLDKKIFTISTEQINIVQIQLKKLNFSHEIRTHCSKVTVVGNRITGIPGVMATIVGALSSEDIQILQSSDSHSTISCLVDESDAKKAVNALHSAFHLDC
ncbi:aspartate kinase [Alkaliphilus metalliredigens QYMF]|uniref:Aspartokinase n=1 Tax=Alkaliphilus metalliredigens (strain QYMF) TaxID=293826 RepID=A6TLT7_ALKMQ|nr:aspartate kinase [Alkaliphilus metalliredigens]ABR47155.1 aspartate kinase [Alkaliphilus metalliredigens QYMF]